MCLYTLDPLEHQQLWDSDIRLFQKYILRPWYREYCPHGHAHKADFPLYLLLYVVFVLLFFSPVISTVLVRCCCFCTLRIDQSIAWSFIFTFCQTYFFDQCFLYFIPYSIHTGSSIEAIYCLPLRKIFWQVPPLTPCFHQVKYRIHLFPLFFYASISRFL